MSGDGGATSLGGIGGEGGIQEVSGECSSFQPTLGKTYYACDCGIDAVDGCVPGDDSAVGTFDQPFRTYDRLRLAFGYLKPGDSVAFCRGGSFSAGQDRRWDSADCDTDTPCTIRDYVPAWGAANLPPPKIEAAGDAFTFDNQGGILGARQILNLVLHGNTAGSAVYASGQLKGLTLCGLDVSAFQTGISFQPWVPSRGVVLQDSYVHDLRGAGFYNGDGTCNDCGVINNIFRRVGSNKSPGPGAILMWGRITRICGLSTIDSKRPATTRAASASTG